MENGNVCIIPGVFDPVTTGHLDIILRASKLFDKIYVVSFNNTTKKTMFDSSERFEMLRLACEGISNITIDSTNKLVVDYAKEKNAEFIIKGVRNIIDFEYESDMFTINRTISDNIEIDTLFFPAKAEHLYISSTFVREMILYKKDISGYVPAAVCDYIKILESQRL